MVEPSLLVTDVEDAPANACSSGSELDPLEALRLFGSLVSICENRSCSASNGLVDADVIDPVDDWLCAASSVLIVAGDISENPLAPEAGAEFPGAEAPPERPNGSVAPR